MSQLTPSSLQTDTYVAEFGHLVESEQSTEPSWLDEARRKGIDFFASVGFPSTRDEEWKFTNVTAISQRTFTLTTPRFRTGDVPHGVTLSSLREAIATNPHVMESCLTRVSHPDRQAFTALNTAFFREGVFVWIPPGTVVEQPVSIEVVASAPGRGGVCHPRILIVAGENSQARIIERYVGPLGEEYLTNAVTEVVVGAGSVIDHYKVQDESQQAFHVGGMYVQCGRSASFSSHSIALGGKLVRNDVLAVLDNQGAECTLNGLYQVDGHRLVDNHTTIDHAKPHCVSHELYKGIIGGHARAVFNGKIIVHADAQKTDAKQTNKALLLSNEAQINTKPQLEIFANDVKCTHGAAVGQLDDDAIFYLRTRGLDIQQARQMLIRAFAGEVLERIRLHALKRSLEERLHSDLLKFGSREARRQELSQ